MCQTPMSFSAAEQVYSTEHRLQPTRKFKVGRKMWREVVCIMGLAVRRRKIQHLKDANCIGVALDARNGWKLVRYKTEHGCSGLLGLLEEQRRSKLEAYEGDISRAAADDIINCIRHCLGPPFRQPNFRPKSLCGSPFCVLSQEMRHINFFPGPPNGGFLGGGEKFMFKKFILLSLSVPYSKCLLGSPFCPLKPIARRLPMGSQHPSPNVTLCNFETQI